MASPPILSQQPDKPQFVAPVRVLWLDGVKTEDYNGSRKEKKGGVLMKQWKLLPVFLLLVVLLGVLATPASAVSGSDLCYKYTPQMTENTFRYLQEIYIEKHPEAALCFEEGTQQDQQDLAHLADVITQGCATDEEKAAAIAGWIARNIEYDEYAGTFYAADVFYARKGNCAAYAQLMQALLRLEGIPAVWGDGFRTNTQELKVEDIPYTYDGHAWCFAYVDGQWKMYDPLWEGTNGLTDREYIAKNYFLDTVDQIVPVYDLENLPPLRNAAVCCVYAEGRFYLLENGEISNQSDMGGTAFSINNAGFYYFTKCRYSVGDFYNDPWTYPLDPSKKAQMVPGELYRDGWVAGEPLILTYKYVNGVAANGVVKEFKGKTYFLQFNSAWQLEAEDYYIEGSWLHVEPGYEGKILLPYYYERYKDDDEYEIVWESDYPDIATVDEHGYITSTGKTGYVSFQLTLRRKSDNGLLSLSSFQIGFMEKNRVADFTDHAAHTCSFFVKEQVPSNCLQGGYTVYACECGQEYTQEDSAPLGHRLGQWYLLQEPTADREGVQARSCDRCGWEEFQSIPAGSDPSNHPTYPEDPNDPGNDGEHTCQWEVVEIVPSWCDEEGYTVYACVLCGIEKVDDFTSAGHQYGPWEIWQEADEYNTGFRIRYCELCGTEQGQEIPAGSGGQMPPDPTDPPRPTDPRPTDPGVVDPVDPTDPIGPGGPQDVWLDAEGDSQVSVLFPGADPEQLDGVTVQATPVDMDIQTVEQLKSFLENNTMPVTQLHLVDITLMAGGHIIQPDGIVVVQMVLPDTSWGEGVLAVYHIGENGELTPLHWDLSEDGSSVLFVVEHFSYYALVLHGDGNGGNDPANPGGSENPGGSANPGGPGNTGDPSAPGASGGVEADILPWILVAALAVVIVVGTVVVIILFKKRK